MSNSLAHAELKRIQAENADLIKQNANAIAALENKLGELVDVQKKTEQRLEAFIFESQRLISSNKGTIDQLKALCDRYDGVLTYLIRKEQGGDSALRSPEKLRRFCYHTRMKLPNPEEAVVDDKKLAGYCLNPRHSDGRHKARVFKSALSLSIENIEELKSALLRAIKDNEAVPDKRNPYGQKYVIDFSMIRGDKTAMIHSVWIVRDDETFPRLITCYVL